MYACHSQFDPRRQGGADRIGDSNRWYIGDADVGYALEGLGQLINTIELVQEHYNPSLLVSTMVVTMFDRRTLLSREVYDEVKKHYPNIVLDTTIPRTVKISEAPSFGKSVIAYDPRGIGAVAYVEAALEIARRSPSVLAAIAQKRRKH